MATSLLDTFLEEAEELFEQIEQSALSVATDGPSEETVHQLFRAMHTVKGSAGLCGLSGVAGFTHHVENLLEQVRAGELPATRELANLVLKANDHIKSLVASESRGEAVDTASGELLLAEVGRLASGEAFGGEVPSSEPARKQGAGQSDGHGWLIRFRPNPTMLAFGGNPAALLKDLRQLGPCEITGHTDDVPGIEEIEPDRCYLHWTIRLAAPVAENAVRDVFIFVEEGSELEIERIEGAAQSLEEAPEEPRAEQPGVRELEAAARPVNRHKTLAKESTVRVPSERLDHLVNLVGEFVMNQSRLAEAVAREEAGEIGNPVQELERLVAELRDSVLGIRMLPIGTLFGRFSRLVHDLSTELGKDVELVTEGDEAELDKSILDQLGEPLVHCLRNALDHAVEPPEERVEQGKPARACIRLSAVHTGSAVVVSVEDDGRGIDRAKVRAKAVERGLISADQALGERELLNLVLAPGFSTATQVTNISGRGVGMDAVKRQIELLRGSISIASEEGRGTSIAIRLPLTLAIIEGLLVEVGADQFIVPMTAVHENVELVAADRDRNNGRNVIAVRGELVPYIDLRGEFAIAGSAPPIEKVVIVQHEGDRVGLVVDRVLGTHQTVIQSLGRMFRNIDVVSGATIMGDGRVALILDITAVVKFADRRCETAPPGSPIYRETPAAHGPIPATG